MHTLKDSDTSAADRRALRPRSVPPHTGATPPAWVSSPRGNGPAEFTEEQRTLFSKWSTLNDEQKKALLALINTM